MPGVWHIRSVKGILILALMAAGHPVHEGRLPYAVVAGDGFIELRVDKTGLLRGKSHRFTFDRYRSDLLLDADDLVRSSVTLTLQAGSIVCRDTWLSAKDLKKVQAYALNEMLAASSYPEIRFVSGAISAMDANHFEVSGTLTLRGISKPAIVHVGVLAGGGQQPRFQGTATIRLTDYALKPPTAVLGAIGTRNEMELSFRITARPKTETD